MFPKQVWDQIKNVTASELIRALKKDGWTRRNTSGSSQGFSSSDGRYVSIHVHPKKTYGPKLLRALIKDIGWDQKDLKRLKLIK